jgi:hypothetical protein
MSKIRAEAVRIYATFDKQWHYHVNIYIGDDVHYPACWIEDADAIELARRINQGVITDVHEEV